MIEWRAGRDSFQDAQSSPLSVHRTPSLLLRSHIIFGAVLSVLPISHAEWYRLHRKILSSDDHDSGMTFRYPKVSGNSRAELRDPSSFFQ